MPSADFREVATNPRSPWFIPVSVVVPGSSAIIGDPALFWVMHSTALLVLFISILSSFAVLAHSLDVPLPPSLHTFGGGLFREWTQPRSAQRRHSPTLDFASRVSIYIAIADLFWCTVRFLDHIYHVVVQRIPSVILGQIIGFVVCLLFGYHQLLSACLSVYAFFRVIKEKPVHLGALDWIVHCCSLGPSVFFGVMLASFGTFGPSGFWCLANVQSSSGIAVSFMAFFVTLLNALVTTGCRYLISSKLEDALSAVASDSSSSGMATASSTTSATTAVTRKDRQVGQVARASMATHTRVASITYIPLALATYSVAMFQAQGYIEPLSCLCTVVCANIMGLSNAYGYFRTEGLKLELRRQEATSLPPYGRTRRM